MRVDTARDSRASRSRTRTRSESRTNTAARRDAHEEHQQVRDCPACGTHRCQAGTAAPASHRRAAPANPPASATRRDGAAAQHQRQQHQRDARRHRRRPPGERDIHRRQRHDLLVLHVGQRRLQSSTAGAASGPATDRAIRTPRVTRGGARAGSAPSCACAPRRAAPAPRRACQPQEQHATRFRRPTPAAPGRYSAISRRCSAAARSPPSTTARRTLTVSACPSQRSGRLSQQPSLSVREVRPAQTGFRLPEPIRPMVGHLGGTELAASPRSIRSRTDRTFEIVVDRPHSSRRIWPVPQG